MEPLIARSPAEVLGRIEKKVDAVFLDMGSATLQGARLLQVIRDQSPTLPVVICTTGGGKDDVVLALRQGCADWIDKPATKAAGGDAIKRIARETRRLAQAATPAPAAAAAATGTASAKPRAFVKEIIARIKDGAIAMPEMPQALDELRRTLSNLESSPAEVLRVLEKDPAIATQVVATANTAAYGGRARISDLKSAVTRLGNRTIASLAQAAALRGLFAFKLPAFRKVFERMWTAHCLTAALAREIATEIKDPDPEQVFMVCLLQNAGEQFMLRLIGEICQRQREQVVSMEEVFAALRDTHTSFGASLLKKWDIGPLFELVARRHHDPSFEAADPDPRNRSVLHLCNLADRLVIDRGLGLYNETLPGPDVGTSFEALKISELRRPFLANRVLELAAEMAPLLG